VTGLPLELAAAVARAARRVDGVVDLHGGLYGEIATHQPGERILGVRLGDAAGEVHIVVSTRTPVNVVGERVRALAEEITGMPITVVVADLALEQTS